MGGYATASKKRGRGGETGRPTGPWKNRFIIVWINEGRYGVSWGIQGRDRHTSSGCRGGNGSCHPQSWYRNLYQLRNNWGAKGLDRIWAPSKGCSNGRFAQVGQWQVPVSYQDLQLARQGAVYGGRRKVWYRPRRCHWRKSGQASFFNEGGKLQIVQYIRIGFIWINFLAPVIIRCFAHTKNPTPWGSQVFSFAGRLWIINFVLGGARGVLLKSNAPLSCASDESCGLIREARRRWRVWTSCGTRWQHKYIGEVDSRDARPEMKWSLKILFSLSVELRWWSLGGTSWKLRVLSWKK